MEKLEFIQGEVCYDNFNNKNCYFKHWIDEKKQTAMVEDWDSPYSYSLERENLYKYVKGIVDVNGESICYEHNETEDNYPYFSPLLQQNLFEFETIKDRRAVIIW